VKGDDDIMNQISLKNRFGHVLDTFSTCLQQLFAAFRYSLFFFVFELRACLSLARSRQTESKGNFCLMTLYSHKTFFQPQAIRAKKQTFSNATCVTCAVKRRTAVTSRRRQRPASLARSRGGLLLRRAAEKGWGEGCVL
jgi:hypothetical protein